MCDLCLLCGPGECFPQGLSCSRHLAVVQFEVGAREEVDVCSVGTWCVALPLYLGTDGDRTGGTEPAAQGLLLGPSLRGLLMVQCWYSLNLFTTTIYIFTFRAFSRI